MPLYGVGPTDPLTYATVPALLLGVALLAAMAPPAGRCVWIECQCCDRSRSSRVRKASHR